MIKAMCTKSAACELHVRENSGKHLVLGKCFSPPYACFKYESNTNHHVICNSNKKTSNLA